MYELIIADIDESIGNWMGPSDTAHSVGHLTIVGIYAPMFAAYLGATKKEQELEKIIGSFTMFQGCLNRAI